MKTYSICIAIALLIGAGCFVLWSSGSDDGQAAKDDVVYICSETRQLIVAAPQPTPAVNPATGHPTLTRAMYCAECEKWYATPPSEIFGGNPLSLRCPKHDIPFSVKGPVDEASDGTPQREESQ